MQRNPFHRFDSSDAHSSSQALGEDRFYVNDQKKHFEVNNAADDVEHTIVVDSKQRDPSIYPQPNHFKVYLRSPLTNVVSCDLLSVEFPNVQFVVSPSNQVFEWTETRDDGEDHTLSFSIPTGHYDGPTLAFEILRMMNAKAAVPAYDVQFLPVRGKFLFQVAPSTLSRFRLSFGSNSCSGLLGFGEGTTDWSNEYTNTGVDPDDPTYSGGISSPFYCNLFGDTYVYLSSPELDSNFHELMYNRSLSNPICVSAHTSSTHRGALSDSPVTSSQARLGLLTTASLKGASNERSRHRGTLRKVRCGLAQTTAATPRAVIPQQSASCSASSSESRGTSARCASVTHGSRARTNVRRALTPPSSSLKAPQPSFAGSPRAKK
ncbi:hypothetical protein KFL_008830070 [Klebsormidium nitens]|uniref:DUF5901 domain-containing protein n=1 Tax=Klebsormidium nitens TaxID=105231 RepID=A0A1Y1IM06_KLENI|nr:hypothetical protein KFL_008830070 [Klebsormidium nitens]|eukprot:GAQ91925.1 hypothetical protein KFL_008830070 [Klebsormidium nitens]